MARYAMRVRTPLPATEAFAYMADLRNFADWDPGVTSSEQVKGDAPMAGAEYDLEASGSMLRYTVERFEPPQVVCATAANRFISSVDTITVEADGDGSIVTYDADLTLNGPLKIGDPLLKLWFDRTGDKAAAGLIQKLEGTRLS